MGHHANELIKQIVSMPVHAIGRVTEHLDGALRVQLDSGGNDSVCLARRAASCLLAPEEGDMVLVSGPDASALYVIAVLERDAAKPARVVLGQDAEISVQGKLGIVSDELLIRARHATSLIDQLASFGREMSASIASVKLVGNLCESFFERVSQFAGLSTRTVEGIDQVRSGIVDYRAEQSLSLQGSEVIATAKTLVKVDGGQIHIG